MFSRPLISVLILHSEQAQSLPNVLADLRKQSYHHNEIIVVDADKANTNQIDVLAGQYPEVRFIPFFGDPSFMRMLEMGAKYVKGKYCLVLNIEGQLPKASIELMVQYMNSQKKAIHILGLHTFSNGIYWRKYPSKYLPWMIFTQRTGPTQATTLLHSEAIADCSVFMVSAQSLQEIVSAKNYKTEWGLYFWQMIYCKNSDQRGIAPGISIKTKSNNYHSSYIYANLFSEAIPLINTYSIVNPLRYINYVVFIIFKYSQLLIRSFKILSNSSVFIHHPKVNLKHFAQ